MCTWCDDKWDFMMQQRGYWEPNQVFACDVDELYASHSARFNSTRNEYGIVYSIIFNFVGWCDSTQCGREWSGGDRSNLWCDNFGGVRTAGAHERWALINCMHVMLQITFLICPTFAVHIYLMSTRRWLVKYLCQCLYVWISCAVELRPRGYLRYSKVMEVIMELAKNEICCSRVVRNWFAPRFTLNRLRRDFKTNHSPSILVFRQQHGMGT